MNKNEVSKIVEEFVEWMHSKGFSYSTINVQAQYLKKILKEVDSEDEITPEKVREMYWGKKSRTRSNYVRVARLYRQWRNGN